MKFTYEISDGEHDARAFETDTPLGSIQVGQHLQLQDHQTSFNADHSFLIHAVESLIIHRTDKSVEQKILVLCHCVPRSTMAPKKQN
jgi:hypothetical protein